MKTITFDELFEETAYEEYSCIHLNKIQKDIIYKNKIHTLKLIPYYRDDVIQHYRWSANGDIEHSGEIYISTDLYKLNANLDKVHPGFGCIFDEMLENTNLKIVLFVDEYFNFRMELQMEDYWLCGGAFTREIKRDKFLFINHEEFLNE